jgi:hypothetical protein
MPGLSDAEPDLSDAVRRSAGPDLSVADRRFAGNRLPGVISC